MGSRATRQGRSSMCGNGSTMSDGILRLRSVRTKPLKERLERINNEVVFENEKEDDLIQQVVSDSGIRSYRFGKNYFHVDKDLSFLQKLRRENRFVCSSVDNQDVINVLCCGRSLAGKSRTLSVLEDPCFTPDSSPLQLRKEKSELCVRTCTFLDSNGSTTLKTIRFFVFPGWKEWTEKKYSREIQSTLQRLGRVVIDVLLYFSSFVVGVHEADANAIDELIPSLNPKRVSVVVTNSQKMLTKEKVVMIKELKQEKRFLKHFSDSRLKIHFMGSVRPSKYYSDFSELLWELKKVANMRTALLRYLFHFNRGEINNIESACSSNQGE